MLDRLCDHSGVEAAEFHLPPDQFARLVTLRRRGPPARPPYAGGGMMDALRVGFELLGREVDRRAELARCALVSPDSPEVPPAVRDAADNRRGRGEPLFHPLAL